jgi:GxxExxY protein
MTEIIYKDESYKIIGACMRVHSDLGNGFLEAVYQESLERELINSDIPFKRQRKLSLYYKGEKLKKYYIADFLCYDKIILEIKSLEYLNSNANNQLKNYLKATNSRLGLLVNFGKPSLEYKRVLNSIS